MNRIFAILGYVVIISQIFSIRIPLLSNIVTGYSIKFILFYFFIIFSIFRWMLSIFKEKRIKKIDSLLIVFLIFPYLIGGIRDWGIRNVFEESVLFIMPVAIYAWCQTENLNQKTYVNVFLGTVIVGAIISVLVALRIVETDIWAADGQLVRAAGAVDSTLFLGGIIISYIKFFVFNNNKQYRVSRILCFAAFVSSIVGLLFTQSRSRITIAAVIIFGFVLFNLFNKKSNYGNLKFLGVIILCLIVAVLYVPDIFEQIISQILGRFSTLSDGNIIYRENESSAQINAFLTAPLMGLGWGSRSQFYNMYVHNMYTALLMQGGLLFSLCYFVWLLSFAKSNLVQIIKEGFNCENTICLSLFMVLFVLGFTNAGIVLSGGYFMLLYIFICDKDNTTLRIKRRN